MAPLYKNSTPSSLPWLVVDRCRHVTNVLSTALRTMDSAYNSANIYCILTIRASQTSMNLYHTEAFGRKKFNRHSLPSTYVHNIHHFALLLCSAHVTDWSTGDPSPEGRCHWRAGKARNSEGATLKKNAALLSYRPS